MKRRILSAAAGVLAGLALCTQAFAQSYPSQPVRWVVPYPAGGGTDVLARSIAEAMRPGLGQQVLIENKPGASTIIGAEYLKNAKPDGYTVMSADNATLAFNPYLYKKLQYDINKDFTYIGGIGRFPLALVVNPSVPVKTVREYVAYVAAHPDKASYASPGNGSPHHMAMELFKDLTKAKMQHIPYKGAAPAIQDVVGGQVPAMFLDLAAGLPFMKSGKLKVLAVATPARVASLPSVPTMAEAGLEGMQVYAWQGMLAPAKLPAAVQARLNAELNKALKDPAVQKRFAEFGMEETGGTPDAFRQEAMRENERWGKLIRQLNIQLD